MKNILVVLILLITSILKGQDPHFSQYHASPLTLNPAMTGDFDGGYRVTGNYRQQYLAIGSPYITGTICYDIPILTDKTNNDIIGVGILGLYDQSIGGAFKSSNIAASLSYQKSLDGDGRNMLGIGFQFSYASRSLDPNQLTFSNQFNGNNFDNNLSSNENFESFRKGYFDFNTGVIYTYTDTKMQAYIGGSLYHITSPNISFLKGGSYLLPKRYTIHGGAYFQVGSNENELFFGGLIMQQAGASEKIFGTAYGFKANETAMIYGGLWYRLNDAFIPYIGIRFGNYRIGITYDEMTSDLRNYTPKNGSFEISLSFMKSKEKQVNTRYLQCPF